MAQPRSPEPVPTILITGFEPFDGMTENLSGLLVQHLESSGFAQSSEVDVRFAILPVSYTEIEKRVLELLDEHAPDTVLSFGIGRTDQLITIERVAVNIDDADCCDNQGEARSGQPIAPDGPAAYFSNLPLTQIQQSLRNAGITATTSNHAGTFLCNHLLYLLLREVEGENCPLTAGFFHLPRVEWSSGVAEDLKRSVKIITQIAAEIRSC